MTRTQSEHYRDRRSCQPLWRMLHKAGHLPGVDRFNRNQPAAGNGRLISRQACILALRRQRMVPRITWNYLFAGSESGGDRAASIPRLCGNPKQALANQFRRDSSHCMIRAGFLDPESRKDLTELARDGSAAHRLARRANALVLLDDGMSCGDVA